MERLHFPLFARTLCAWLFSRAAWWAVAGLAMAVVLSYWRVLDTFFVQDDFGLLVAARNPMPNAEMLRGSCFFRPLSTYWLTLLNVSLFGLQWFYHHAIHLLMFLATVVALFGWLRSMAKSTIAALCGAALYAFSKTHLYTLAWIAGGIDVSAALCFVLCLWMIDRCLHSPIGTRASRWLPVGVAVTFAGALLCKESCIVLPPAYLAWIAVRRIAGRRPFQPVELKLAAILVVLAAIYLPCWRQASSVVGSPAGRFQCDLRRGEKVLRDSVIAVVPARESQLPVRPWWLLAPCAMAGTAWALRRKTTDVAEHLTLAIALWTLPAAIFVFTVYPWWLQLYYSHFSVIGLALLTAVTVAAIEAWIAERPIARPVAIGVSVVLLAVWVGFGARTIRCGIRLRESPALRQAAYSRAAYERLAPELKNGQYRRVVLLGVSDLMWASVHDGNMFRVFFPGVHLDCDGRDGYQSPSGERTGPTTLVVRQKALDDMVIVR
ncbi:MAG: hypothetical protein ABFC63_07830 [Thermoguttaceae bacterium]